MVSKVMRIDRSVPILIVGGGPCGLTLANLLGLYGTCAMLVERNVSTVKEPRAVSIDDESLRTMQAVGLSDIVLGSAVPGYGSDYLMPDGRCFLTVEPKDQPFGYPRRNAFRQPNLESQLRSGLSRFPTIEALFGWTMESFAQDEQGVTAQMTNLQGDVQTVRCDYMVGCDGAGSGVRRNLGMVLQGKTFQERWLILDLENSPAERRNTVVFCNSARPCIALPGPDLTRRFEFKLHATERDDDMLRPEVVQELLRSHGAADGSVLVRKVVYTFHARMAPRWCVGRVFLAGDAAHLTPPFAGQGLNSGIRDCANVGWKLALVTAKEAPPQLLNTYEEERREHVAQMIQLALRMGRIMSPKSRIHGRVVQNTFLAISRWPKAKQFFAEMKYKPKPKFDAGFIQPDGLAKHLTLVGRMLGQPRVETVDGRRVLLDELLGSGFAMLGIGITGLKISRLLDEMPIGRFAPTCVSVNPPSNAENDLTTLTVTALDWHQLDPYRGRVLFVRPDRYVAAAGTVDGPESVTQAVIKLLARLSENKPLNARKRSWLKEVLCQP